MRLAGEGAEAAAGAARTGDDALRFAAKDSDELAKLVKNSDWTVPSVKEIDATAERMGFATRNDFGQVAWGGRSLADASKLKTPEQLVKMKEIGMTREDAWKWRNFYQDIHDKSAARFPNNPEKVNPSASSRADLFQYYMDNLGG